MKTRPSWLFALVVAVSVLALAACSGEKGPAGDKGSDGTNGTNGAKGSSCTVTDNGNGTKTIACADGTSVTVNNGAAGATGDAGPAGTSCTVTNNANGTHTITCTDGTSATIADGDAGVPGTNGKDLVNVMRIPSNSVAATEASIAAWVAFRPQVTVTSVTIAGAPVVNFTVKDAAGNPVVGLGSTSQSSTAIVASRTNLWFTLAKLVPGVAPAPSKWVTYLVLKPPTVAEKAATPGTSSCNAATNATWCGTFPTSDSQGTLVDNGDGSYKYTFYRDITQAATIAATLIDSTGNVLSKKADLGDLTYDPTLTHRLGIAISGAAPGTGSNTPNGGTLVPGVNIGNPGNFTYEFRPDGAAVTTTRDIVNINFCAACHQYKGLAHSESRKDPRLCVTCHTDQVKYSFNLGVPIPMDANGNLTGGLTGSTQQKRAEQAILDGRAVGNFPNYIHKLHMGKGGVGVGAAGFKGLHKQGYNFNVDNGAMLFNQNEFPRDIRNCTTCHDGAATGAKTVANGDNWKTVPSRLACGSCHDGIDFATGLGTTAAGATTGHGNGAPGPQTSDALCSTCHTASAIAGYHPSKLPAVSDVSKRTLKSTITGVAVGATDGSVTVTFTLMDGTTPVTATTGFAGLAFTLAKLAPSANGASTHWVNYTGRFRSKLATEVPVYQGYSETALAANVTNVGAGVWTYKFQLLNFVIPGDIRSGIVSVTEQGSVAPWIGLSYPISIPYEPSLTHRVGMLVTNGATPAVDNQDNAYFDFVPDGNLTAETRNIVTSANCATCHAGRKWHKGYTTQLCVTCHNSSTFDPYTGTSGPKTVDLQVLVHKVHRFGTAYVVNGESFGSASPNAGFPGKVQNCQACHVETAGADPKDTANWRTKPNATACGACHDEDPLAVAHMSAQTFMGIQTCQICHGPGAIVDVKKVHAN